MLTMRLVGEAKNGMSGKHKEFIQLFFSVSSNSARVRINISRQPPEQSGESRGGATHGWCSPGGAREGNVASWVQIPQLFWTDGSSKPLLRIAEARPSEWVRGPAGVER
jgi:hypothetical protein